MLARAVPGASRKLPILTRHPASICVASLLGGAFFFLCSNASLFWKYGNRAFYFTTDHDAAAIVRCEGDYTPVVFFGDGLFYRYAVFNVKDAGEDASYFLEGIGYTSFNYMTSCDLVRANSIFSNLIPAESMCSTLSNYDYVICSDYGFPLKFLGVAWGDTGDGIPVIVDGRSTFTSSGEIVPLAINYLSLSFNLCIYCAGCAALLVGSDYVRALFRRRRGRCAFCGYPLLSAGMAETCPECGQCTQDRFRARRRPEA